MATLVVMAPTATAAPAAPPSERTVAVGEASAAAGDVCYKVWQANLGYWQIACNRGVGGRVGEARAIEMLTLNSTLGGLCLKGHVQNKGDDKVWSCETPNSAAVTGTRGESLRLEGVHIRSDNGTTVCAQAHVQDEGWQQPERCGTQIWVGTSNQGKRMEAIKIWRP